MNSKFFIALRFASYALTLLTLLRAYRNSPPTWVQEIEWLDAEIQELTSLNVELQTAIFHGIVFIVMVILFDIVHSFTKFKVLAIVLLFALATYSAFAAYECFHFKNKDMALTAIFILFSLLFAIMSVVSIIRMRKEGNDETIS